MNNPIIDKIANTLKIKPFDNCQNPQLSIARGRLIPKDLTGPQKTELFSQRAISSGSKVHHLKDNQALKEKLAEIITADKRIAIAGGQRLKARLSDDPAALLPETCQYIPAKKLDDDSELFNLNIAITDAHLAIAETGSIVLASDENYPRLTSLTAQSHIVILWPDQIVADMLDFSSALKEQIETNPNHSYTIISGPSKTADIEMKLVIGVHGPGQLDIIIMES
ncbi:MAG: LUD domain-containing protein [Phycisphaerae bacterium]|nr:LUD domain-containing protein [Phycisphaerae bacterium]